MADLSKYDYSISAVRDEFKKHGVFYTPPGLAEYFREFLPDTVSEVYDPTCGNGGLLAVFPDNVKKYGQELDPQQMEVARQRLTNFDGVAGDTLAAPAFMDHKFEAIVANYPFSVPWTPPTKKEDDPRFADAPALAPKSRADYAFILHCLYMLKDDGVAVVMGFPGILYRGNAEAKIRRWLIEQNYIDAVVHIPGKKFADTAIPTCLLILRKNKTTTDVRMIDTEHELERIVTLEEIEAGGFNLSVSQYVTPPDTREPVDIDALNADIDGVIVHNLEAAVNLQAFVYLFFENDRAKLEALFDACASKLEELRERYKDGVTL